MGGMITGMLIFGLLLLVFVMTIFYAALTITLQKNTFSVFAKASLSFVLSIIFFTVIYITNVYFFLLNHTSYFLIPLILFTLSIFFLFYNKNKNEQLKGSTKTDAFIKWVFYAILITISTVVFIAVISTIIAQPD